MEKSKGHLFFTKSDIGNIYEYFQKDNNIYKSQLSDTIMPDGYRIGNFECPLNLLSPLKVILAINSHIIEENVYHE